MKPVFLIISSIVLTGCIDLPHPPVVTQFDGEWQGRRINHTDNPVCLPTQMFGSIKQGKVLFVLEYNDTKLSGKIDQNGVLALSSNNPMWQYQFSGRAKEGRIDGKWSVGNAGCEGEWYLDKKG
ncbi:hypothetical protein [Vibrio sp. SCSIO 43136]|uniref:hypothetical protein n=1 Tax=Vibrio sp. SCSIO 43136 TaxID=2819101 RepID=UPI0020753AC4|nr:hypothetical protein [Vibrio sp. SCSIO 43136]USD64679.1 hypothetical protein J4N39_11390 [Vibrio sp. SCSIO 43136]